MTMERVSAERVDVLSTRSFEETVATLEREVPPADMATLTRLVASRATAPEIETSVAAMAGSVGFMMLGRIEPGPLVSLLGRPKKIILYSIGNPVLANRMYEQEPATGLYAPLRLAIYEDDRGATHLTYERPSASLGHFRNVEIGTVAGMLDEKLGKLTDLFT
jgi:uncharacterized protein (DUF302 family)